MPGITNFIIGVDTSGQMWTSPSLSSNWTRSTSGQTLVAAAGLDVQGDIVGVAATNAEVKTTNSGQSWVGVASQPTAMLSVRACPDGTLLGVGTNNELYTSPNLQTAWTHHANTGSVLDACMMADGTIVGVGMRNNLWTRASVGAGTSWSEVASSGAVKSCCLEGGVLAPGTTFIGVGTAGDLFTRDGLNGTWQSKSWPSIAPNNNGANGVIFIAVGSSGGGLPI